MSTLCMLAYRHMRGFWTGRGKVPVAGGGGWNDAIRGMEKMFSGMRALVLVWGVGGLVDGIRWAAW